MKILLIGDEEVGKTQIFNQFVNNKFDDKYKATIGLEISHKNKDLSIYDIAGQERFQSISTSYHQGTTAYILVYDVTNHTSFDNIKKHIEEVKLYNDNISIILVGNKNDLTKDRTVNTETAKKFATKNNMIFFETSAKENSNIEELFKAAINITSLEEIEKETEKDQNLTKSKLTWDFWRILFTSATALSLTTLMITAITAVILSQTGHLGHVAAYATLASVGSLSLLSTTFFGGAEITLKAKDALLDDKNSFFKSALSFCHRVENEKESENYKQM